MFDQVGKVTESTSQVGPMESQSAHAYGTLLQG